MKPSKVTKTIPMFTLLEDDLAFLRKPQVLALYPVGERSWDRGVAEGRYPKPVKLSKRVSAWRVADIRALLASVNQR
jgi:prophage regulatory protein